MTKFKASHRNDIYRIEVDGHATGSSDVCAGISSLCYAMIGFAENSNVIVKSMDVSDAHFEIEFQGMSEARAAYKMMTIGLSQIAQSYPDYCRGEID